MDPALAREVLAVSRHRAINEVIDKGESDIQQFYAGATVFVTGGSGFLGKQLVEKLFRSCDVKKVYVLLRPKKGKKVEARLEEILKDPVYESLHKKKPDFTSKLVAVEGDVSEIRLGIAEGKWEAITEEVDIIFHVAATVNFEESLRVATLTNVRGTREMVLLGKACKKLRCFVHVSTAFSHATRSRFEQDVVEQFYASPVPPSVMIEMVEAVETKRLDDITPYLIENWPNTYTFTKSIAEEVIRTMAADLPACIVRPAIVIGSYREPSPGWLDSTCAYGPSGMILGVGLGIMHVLLAAKDVKIDLVPVDLVNNAIMAAGWATATRRAAGETEAKIYTVTNMRNYIYFHVILDTLNIDVKAKYTTPKAMWYSFVYHTDNLLLYSCLTWLLHFIPAYLVDTICWIIGKPQVFLKVYVKAEKLIRVLSYFTCNEWKFSDDNTQSLCKALCPNDKVVFNFDIASVDWDEQMVLWAIGIRRYIIKDGLKDTEYALKKQFWLRILHYSVCLLAFFILWKVIALSISVISYVFTIL